MEKCKYILFKRNNIAKCTKNVNYICIRIIGLCAIFMVLVLYGIKLRSPSHFLLLNRIATLSKSFRMDKNYTRPTQKSSDILLPPVNQFTTFSKSIRPDKYYVNTKNCKIPWVDPFSEWVLQVFIPPKYQCSLDRPLVSTTYNRQIQQYILKIDSTVRREMNCVYREVVHSGLKANGDGQYRLLSYESFANNFTVPQHVDGMIIECQSKRTNQIVEKDAFSFIQPRIGIKTVRHSTTSRKKPSVFLIGVDSLSRFNFRRNMPKTADYLAKNKWFELEGYNRVADDTFSSIMPLLTGFNVSQAQSLCKPQIVGGLDECDFIWQHFKQHGYWTAYGEDVTSTGIFNLDKKGFRKPPTDFYLRPLMLAVEEELDIIKYKGQPYCCGRRRQCGEYVFDFGLEFFKRYQSQPAFGFFWTNSFSHNDFDMAATMDVKIRAYFEKFERDGILDDAIVVFLSDYGQRRSLLNQLPEGFLEERLPMCFISVPKWFQQAQPDFVRALQINKNRLTTPYDIHQTLKHILDLSSDSTAKERTNFAPACPGAQSIFREIRDERTCKDACIPEYWCACSPYEILAIEEPLIQTGANLIVDKLNNYLDINNFSLSCEKLKIKSVVSAELEIEQASKKTLKETFRIKIITSPKDALFQATVEYNLKTHNISVGIEHIRRLNSYANHANCVTNKLAKKYCICKH